LSPLINVLHFTAGDPESSEEIRNEGSPIKKRPLSRKKFPQQGKDLFFLADYPGGYVVKCPFVFNPE
jgi:hypothetical protein